MGRNALLALTVAAQRVAECHDPHGPERLTAVPTILRSGEAFNVVPAAGELFCDIRADALGALERVVPVVPAEVNGVCLDARVVRRWPGMDAREATSGLLEAASARLGRPVIGAERGGASDASHLAGASPSPWTGSARAEAARTPRRSSCWPPRSASARRSPSPWWTRCSGPERPLGGILSRPVRVSAHAHELPLAETFTIARSSRDTTEVVWAELEHDGVVGHGEGAPVDYWGETVEGMLAFLADRGARAARRRPVGARGHRRAPERLATGRRAPSRRSTARCTTGSGGVSASPSGASWGSDGSPRPRRSRSGSTA